jgi:hypothetical protein
LNLAKCRFAPVRGAQGPEWPGEIEADSPRGHENPVI